MRNIKRFLSTALCILLIISALPLTAGASGEVIEWLAGNRESDGHDIFFYCTTVVGNSATVYEIGNREGNSIILSNNNHYVNYDIVPSHTGTYTLEVEASSHESKPEVLHAYANDEEIGTLNIADGNYISYTEGYRTIGTVEMIQGEEVKISFSNKTADNSGNGSGKTMICIKGLRLTYVGEADDTDEPEEDNIIWKAGYTASNGGLADGYSDIPYTVVLASGGEGVIGNIGSDYGYMILFGETNHKICYEVTPKCTGIYSLKVQAGGNNTLKAFKDGEPAGELVLTTGEWNTYCDLTEIAEIELTKDIPTKIAFAMANAGLIGLQDISLTYVGEAEAETDEAVEAVISAIDAIGEVTLDSEEAIEAAEEAYEALTVEQKEQVTNYDVLVAARETLEQLKSESVIAETIKWKAGYTSTSGEIAEGYADIPYTVQLAGGGYGTIDNIGSDYGYSILYGNSNHKMCYEVTPKYTGIYSLKVQGAADNVPLKAFLNGTEAGEIIISTGSYDNLGELAEITELELTADTPAQIALSKAGSGLLKLVDISLTYVREITPDEPDNPELPPDEPDNPPSEAESIEWMAGYEEADGHDIYYYVILLNGDNGTALHLGNKHGDSMVLDSNNHKLNYDVSATRDGVYTLEVEASTNESKPEVLYAYANDEEIGKLEIADGGYVNFTEGYREIGTVKMRAGRNVKIGFSNKTAEDSSLGKNLICLRGIKLTYKEELSEEDIENDPLTPPHFDVKNATVYKGQVGEVKLNLTKKGYYLKEYTVKVICPTADVASILTLDAPEGTTVVSNISGATVEYKVTGISKTLDDFGTINYPAYANTTLKISAHIVYNMDGIESEADVPEVTASISTLINTNNGGSGSTSGFSGGGGGSFKPSQTVPDTGTEDAHPAEESKMFTDLSTALWAEENIMNLYNKGIISKAADGRFRPDDSVTRAEFVKMLVTALGITDENGNVNLNDVSEGEWYYTYVCTAVRNGLVLGDEKGNFRPNDKITRQDICVIVSRAMDKLGYTQPESYGDVFADDAQISDYAKSAVYRMRTHEIVNGVGMGNFAPLSDATRAATAKIIDTFMKEANI